MIASPAAAQNLAERSPLDSGWETACAPDVRTPDRLGDLPFSAARVPGTVPGAADAQEHWFRCRFESQPASPGEQVILNIGGIATLSEVWLNGRSILRSDSMFASHAVDVSSLLRERGNELLIACRSLSAALRAKRGRQPHARWRTRIVSEQQLRWFRTSILGRAPGFAPGPPPVGPWRPIELERRRHIAAGAWSRRVELDGPAGMVQIEFHTRELRDGARPVSGWLRSDQYAAKLEWEGSRARALLRIPHVRRWWPHTHGEPALYPLRAELRLEDRGEVCFDDLPAGFRSLECGTDFGLKINGVPIFCRGVVWTPSDDRNAADRLRLLRGGGFNLIRVPGTGAYESETFHALCDQLGLLVWQDMMFANMDYPFEDAEFLSTVRGEAAIELAHAGRHPSTAVICGNSEMEQQVGMLGLDPALGRVPFFREELPRMAAQFCPGVPYVPSAPCGGDQPFRARSGVANYFGVGAYLRPLEDVRRAEVRFASECLAMANVPEPELIEKMTLDVPGGISPTHPAWKRGVPRDAGAGWDFEDVRDHYLKLLYPVDPASLRYADARRYLEMSRMVSGEIMAEVFGEWRRPASPCAGGIILWGADLEPGAGWGILDSTGWPKAPYWFLKRLLAPHAVWTTDEGLNGVDVHVANDRPSPLEAWLRVALYAHGEQKTAEAERLILMSPHQSETFGLEEILGRFVDASYAYRFGPPCHTVIAVSLHASRGEAPFAQAFRFPVGRGADREPISGLGITAVGRLRSDGTAEVLVSSRRLAWGVRVAAAGALADDCYFGIEPGGSRRIRLSAVRPGAALSSLTVTAVNADGRIPVEMEALA